MEERVLIFGKNFLHKNVFQKHKHLIDIDKVDIDIIVISSKGSYAKKRSFNYFIGYITVLHHEA